MSVPGIKYGDDLNFPWRQFISKNGWTGDLSYGPEGLIAAEIIQIEMSNLEQALAQILGYSRRVGSTLKRKLPMAHPRFPWLYANRITKVEGIKPTGPEAFTPTHGALMDYKLAHLTVQFVTPTYRVIADGHVGEWDRFVTKTGKSTAQFLTREIGSFKWSAGTTPSVTDSKFLGSHAQLLTKRRLNWIWHKIPERGWLDSDGIPTNYQRGLGCVNAKTFAGFPAGTLLMEAADNEQPEMQTDWDGNQTKPSSEPIGGLPRVFNIPLNFIHFDPKYGGVVRGHNLAPHPKTGLWFLVHSDTAYLSGESGTTTNDSKTVTGVANAARLVVGSVVTGSGILADTQIESIDGTTITLTRPASATGGTTLAFYMVRYPAYDFEKIFQMNE